MRKIHSLLAFIIGMIWLPACGQQSFDEKMKSLYKNTVPIVNSDQLENLKKQGDVFILDAREPEEFRVSHIPGARLIGYDDFDKNLIGDIPKDAKVVVYCSVGYRSERIGEKMQKMGFENVSNLYGGIFDWKNQGNTVFNINQEPTDSVHTYNKNWSQWLYKGVKVYD
ncbi:rhodanese-like domain-containing protein [Marinoscillum pacificum]|uniref:rhodanese-like domain-containing protein n=1 Tax=Marinoscillum pacificum TaxID=392723 RepID=UPI002157E216|nr:rhodanese-like domain-containing protein [Marinoscillum pacificum]